MSASPRTAVCTIVSKNYLPYARTLMQAIAGVYPGWDRYVLLADETDGYFDPSREPFKLIGLQELGLPEPQKFLFRYDVLELNTAVKPWLLERLFERDGVGRVVYLDPDICVYSELTEVERALDRGSLMVLTPHLLAPTIDDRRPNDADILRAGCYNLGFIALAAHPELRRFLRWWQDRLTYDCRVELSEGLFVDQKWMDLAPGLFDGVAVLRHPGYNVAYWNLQHRDVRAGGGRPTVNGEPLAFFHFSGLDPLAPESLSKHQNRHQLRDLPGCRPLVEDYCRRVLANGWEECRHWPYAYGATANGTPIARAARRLYRSNPEAMARAGDDPFRDGGDYPNEPFDAGREPLVTRLMRAVWESRDDLRRAFPDLAGNSRETFVAHFLAHVAGEEGIAEAFVEPVRESLRAWAEAADAAARTSTEEPPDIYGAWALRVAIRAALVVVPTPRAAANGVPRKVAALRALRPLSALRPARVLVPRAVRRQLRREIRRVKNRETHGRPEGGLLKALRNLGAWFRAVLPLGAPRPQARNGPSPGRRADDDAGTGLNLVGYLETESGVGESARLSLQAATAAGIPTAVCGLAPSGCPLTGRVPAGPHPVTLVHVNADQTRTVRAALGEAYFAGRHTVGVWHWELPRFPSRWLPAFDCVDELWAPSRFISDALTACSRKPVYRIPHAIRFAPNPTASRREFGLPGGDFLFLMMFDVQSFGARKNPEGAVEAFRRAFGDVPGVTLVIKVNDSLRGGAPGRRVRECVGDMKNVRVVDSRLSRQRAYDLLAVCDAVVSVHRSEGFGLVLAEAMFLGKPVVATGWSGNLEFMTPRNSCLVDYRPVALDRDIGPYERGQIWAEPDLDHAAELMRELAHSPEHARTVGGAGRDTVHAELAPERVGGLYRERLAAIAGRPPAALRIYRPAA